MTDRWRDAEDNRRRALEDRRQNHPTSSEPARPPAKLPKSAGRDEPSHGPDGGLDSGRGFGRIGVSRSDPWAGERGPSDSAGRSPWAHGRRDDFTGRGPKNYRRPDQRILEDVSDRLTDDAIVDASEITVDVKHGEVTLSGTVKDRHQKRRAQDAAERVSGVKDVINVLRIAATGKSGV